MGVQTPLETMDSHGDSDSDSGGDSGGGDGDSDGDSGGDGDGVGINEFFSKIRSMGREKSSRKIVR